LKKLIVTADDVGRTPGSVAAAREAREGLLTCAALCPTGEAFDEAAAWARTDPGLGVGVHFDLDRFFRIDLSRPSVDWDYADPRVPLPALRRALREQAARVAAAGLKPAQVSSRHHLHLRPELLPLVCDAAREAGIPLVRFFAPYYPKSLAAHAKRLLDLLSSRGLKHVPYFIDGWYWGNVDEPFEAAELACAPSHDDERGRAALASCRDFRLREYLRFETIHPTAPADFLRGGQPPVPSFRP
jgi:predicted glycoside hydrolase/deacetylase ChbG (UPF0249 family)